MKRFGAPLQRAGRRATARYPCPTRGGGSLRAPSFRTTRRRRSGRARIYAEQGADELVVLDVSATLEERTAALDVVRQLRSVLRIPLTVGGGVRSVDDAQALLAAGADKVAVNSAAVARPELLNELAARFGRQCTVSCGRAWRSGPERARGRGGRAETSRCVWIAGRGRQRGAGCSTSWDQDGTRSGYDLKLLRAAARRVRVPIIASGGASTPAHMTQAFQAGAHAVLAASIFHDDEMTCAQVKTALRQQGMEVRI